jgi:hypothetical protein
LRIAEDAARRVRTATAPDTPANASAYDLIPDLNFGWDVNPRIPTWYHGCCSQQRPLAIVRPGKTDQATQFNLCHELGHYHLEAQLKGEMLERACQRFAAALLMPAAAFMAKVRELGRDPYALQGYFQHCSLEALASRISDLFPNMVTAAWDWYSRKWLRLSDGLVLLAGDFRAMDKALGWAYAARDARAKVVEGGVKVYAWRTSSHPHTALTVCEVVL